LDREDRIASQLKKLQVSSFADRTRASVDATSRRRVRFDLADHWGGTMERTGGELIQDFLGTFEIPYVFGNPGTTETTFLAAVAAS
jgi:hypothetical protein